MCPGKPGRNKALQLTDAIALTNQTSAVDCVAINLGVDRPSIDSSGGDGSHLILVESWASDGAALDRIGSAVGTPFQP